MTEPLDDTELAEHLRTGFDALADEIGDPPRFPDRSGQVTPLPGARTRAYAVAAAVALVVLVGGALVWSQRSDPPHQRVAAGPTTTLPPRGPDRPLEETRWWLHAASDDGDPVELNRDGIWLRITPPGDSPPRDCTGAMCDGPVVAASDACNGITRVSEVGPTTIRLGQQVGGSTMMACSSPLVTLLGDVYAGGEITYEIQGDELTITRDGAELTYVASDGPFAPTSGTVVDEGEVGPASYRAVWSGGGLEFQKEDTEHGLAIGGAGLGDDPGRINMMRSSLMGRPYVFAIVPKEAARVVYEPAGGEPQDLEIHRVDSPTSSVVAQFVEGAPDTWQLVAYDSDGVELHRYGWWPRQDMGAGLSLEELVPKAGLQGCCKHSGAREAFTSDGVAMTIASGPLPPSMPRDPALGLTDPERVAVPPDGTAIIGSVRDEAEIRFDCAETRYDVRAPQASADALVDVAGRLSTAAGCPQVRIAEP